MHFNPDDPDWQKTATGRYFSYKCWSRLASMAVADNQTDMGSSMPGCSLRRRSSGRMSNHKLGLTRLQFVFRMTRAQERPRIPMSRDRDRDDRTSLSLKERYLPTREIQLKIPTLRPSFSPWVPLSRKRGFDRHSKSLRRCSTIQTLKLSSMSQCASGLNTNEEAMSRWRLSVLMTSLASWHE